jgi:hypothetical protein
VTCTFAPNRPRLLIEFCRVSRDGCLTLAIDETFGASCATYSTPSHLGILDQALLNLWVREGSDGEPPRRDVRGMGGSASPTFPPARKATFPCNAIRKLSQRSLHGRR